MRRRIHKLAVRDDFLVVFFARSIYKINTSNRPKRDWYRFKYMNILKNNTYTRTILSNGIDSFSLKIGEVFYNNSGVESEVTRITKTEALKLCL